MAALTREKIQDGIAEAKTETSIVKPYVMSHGTMEVYSLKASRKFYEEFAIPADSFARMVAFAIGQPEDVDVNEILFRPTRQEL